MKQNPRDYATLISVIGLFIAACACVAAWLVVPPIQSIFEDSTKQPEVSSNGTSNIETPVETTIPIGFPDNPVLVNNNWIPIELEFNGVQMVLVPVGCFWMGSNDGNSDEQPVNEQCFDRMFLIDKYEVTNTQFQQLNGFASHEGYWTPGDYPRDSVTWIEARDFCQARDARLPTEREWEYAARGPDGLIYPWGNNFDKTLVSFCDFNCPSGNGDNTVDDNYDGSAPVGSFPGNASWVGAYDMSGNLWEWVSSLYMPYPYATDAREVQDENISTPQRVVRGGAWNSSLEELRASERPTPSWLLAGSFPGLFGFRCVMDVDLETIQSLMITP